VVKQAAEKNSIPTVTKLSGAPLAGKYPVNPLYPALKRLPFSGFQSSLIADRKRQCNPARDRNPAKGKPLLRQGAQMATVHGQGIFL